MTEAGRQLRNQTMLGQVYAGIRQRMAAVVHDLESHGFRPRIQCAWRSPVAQAAAFRRGVSHVKFGFHNCTAADGTPEALACDVLDDDRPEEETRTFRLMLLASALAHGLRTGALYDLEATDRAAIKLAAQARDWDYAGPMGWDPNHVEVVDVTISEARAGKRPA